ncbi:ribosome biogenesis GTPase Der [Anaeromyxobacter dehalogenans]|uniref:GTPase Der n=1 Tax=Anaeromyxobacter dehalogenans (strain 2CP-C) TaxID=290397 RepID=Q2IIE5_ANADE|nr:ribosome biogenesis GTPase Der [Anaeromyxobacter dehalogenans]ABC81427.1 small GTP-binding protein [Anaeromyxobacter dehalogenans 2CP-C]
MSAPRPVVALVGRPNVGKSTLFNRLAGRRVAIVEDVPGVTRDRNYADVIWEGRAVSVVDTGGFEPESRDRLMSQVREQAQLAVDEASVVVLVVDGRDGLTSLDRAVAELLRRAGKPLFVAVNKVDTARTEEDVPLAEFYGLGFGEVHALSAEHGRGVSGLVDAIVEKLALPPLPPAPEEADEPQEVSEEARPVGDIRLAIVGRPNVGKSTFVNALLGEERFVVSDVPGTTRDAIDSLVAHKGRRFVVTDTAGIRRKRSIAQKVESFSVVRAMKAMDQAEVVACLLDATEAGVEQDARLLGLVAEKGKALVIVVNKWDIAEREGATQDWYRKELTKRLPFVAFAPMLFVSAKERRGVHRVLEKAARLVEQYRARFPTPQLNELLEALQDEHPAPVARGRRVKLYYVAQVAYAPPTFVIQANHPDGLTDHYRRYIENRFRDAFGLEVPMRLVFKERQHRTRPRRPRE